MAWIGQQWWKIRLILVVIGFLVFASTFVSAQERREEHEGLGYKRQVEWNNVIRVVNHTSQSAKSGYKKVWPDMKFGWRIVLGTILGFFGAGFASVGGVGGGGIYVPMFALIIGFDEKSSTAMSKCMIVGGATATCFYNLRQKHPTLDLPIIDYDLALLFQPMLMLGISIGVALNVIFADWMITVLLIICFMVPSTKSFFRGIETWKRETVKKEAASHLQSNGMDAEAPAHNNTNPTEPEETKTTKVSMLKNVHWKELGILTAVWVVVLALQIAKNYTRTCSVQYWLLNFLQIPVTVGVTSYEAVSLYKGRRVIASKGEAVTEWRVIRLIVYCGFGILAGITGGLLGVGGGFILNPMFLEIGIPPQVSSATSIFVMTFSSSMSVVEYYLLKRFPVPFALYFAAVATISAVVGQYLVGKVIKILGRASLIIFILFGMIFTSAVSLGGVGIARVVESIEHKEYMGFENICKYQQ
ncbi:hypothetical protein UlMin_018138 [Ulmus minor]